MKYKSLYYAINSLSETSVIIQTVSIIHLDTLLHITFCYLNVKYISMLCNGCVMLCNGCVTFWRYLIYDSLSSRSKQKNSFMWFLLNGDTLVRKYNLLWSILTRHTLLYARILNVFIWTNCVKCCAFSCRWGYIKKPSPGFVLDNTHAWINRQLDFY